MKKLIALLLLISFFIVCGQAYADDYEKIFSSENVLIDVRTPEEYKAGHLDRAVNIPFNKVVTAIKDIVSDKDDTVIIYCKSGKRADFATRKLKELGYTNVINAGRFKDLKKIEEERKE